MPDLLTLGFNGASESLESSAACTFSSTASSSSINFKKFKQLVFVLLKLFACVSTHYADLPWSMFKRKYLNSQNYKVKKQSEINNH